MGIMDPPPKTAKMGPAIEQINREVEGCDRCGVSKDGQPIADAIYRIRTRKGGVIWLCGHHCHEHWAHIVSEGYDVTLV